MRQDTFLGRLGTAIGLSAGFQVVYLFGLVLLSFFVMKNVPADPQHMPLAIAVMEGQPLTRYFIDVGSPARWDFRTMDHQPVQLREKQQLMWGAHLPSLAEQHPSLNTRRTGWTVSGLLQNQNPTEPWYFIREPLGSGLTGYFVAYSVATRLPTLYLGPGGASPTIPSLDQRFQLKFGGDVLTDRGMLSGYVGGLFPVQGLVSVLTVDGLYRVDLLKHSVEKVISDADLVCMAPSTHYLFESGGIGGATSLPQDPVMVRGADIIYQIENQKVTARYTIPAEMRDRGCVAYPVDPTSVYYATSLGAERHSIYSPRQLLKCDAAGHTLQTWELKQPVNSLYDMQTQVQLTNYMAGVLVCPAPVEMVVTLGLLGPQPGMDRLELTRIIWPSLVLLVICGVLSAVGAWLLAPRFSGAPAEWGWLLFVFVLGLPGLMGYLMHFRHRRRPVLAPAATLGNEVFA